MTPTFLERNKKKSALAALLLLLRRHKGLSLLLSLILVSSMAFVIPSSVLIDLPGGTRLAAGAAWLAQKLGVDVSRWGLRPGSGSYGDLLTAFQSAKENGSRRGFLPGAAERGGDGKDFLDRVRGHRSDLETAGLESKLPQGKVAGIIHPDDVKADRDAGAVALTAEDLEGREGLVRNAFAGGFTAGLLGGAAGAGGVFAGKGLLSGGLGASSNSSDFARAALQGQGFPAVPRTAVKGAAKGKLSALRAHSVDARAMKGASNASALGGRRALFQLGEGRGLAAMSTAPECAPPDCPGEYAATNTGAIYDGNRIRGAGSDVLTSPVLDSAAPNVPDSGIAQQYEREAEQMEKDAQICQDANARYGPQETQLNRQMEDLSQQFRALGCGGGGCSKSKAKKCKKLGDQMKANCQSYMHVRCEHTRACPLTKNTNCSDECDATGNSKTQQTHYDPNAQDTHTVD